MEKRYLVINKDGRMIGAFEGVDRFEEFENGISFTSEEGSFDYEKGEDGIYRCEENPIEFDSYEVLGRRAVNRRLPSGSVKDVRHRDDDAVMNHSSNVTEGNEDKGALSLESINEFLKTLPQCTDSRITDDFFWDGDEEAPEEMIIFGLNDEENYIYNLDGNFIWEGPWGAFKFESLDELETLIFDYYD